MVSFKSALVAAAALVAQASAQDVIKILAVQDLTLPDTFVFKPNSLTANVGDILEFHFAPTGFLPSNHSVVQGTFDRACRPMGGGFFSGFVPADPDSPIGEADTVFQVRVTSTAPIAFYCATGEHCTRGMTGVVNPTDSQNLESYRATIPKNEAAVAPAAVRGGQTVPNPGPIDVATLPAAAGSFKASMAGIVGALAFALLMG